MMMNSSSIDIESAQPTTEEQQAPAAETVSRRKRVCWLAITLVALLAATSGVAAAIAVTPLSSNKDESAKANNEEVVEEAVHNSGSRKQMIGAVLRGGASSSQTSNAVDAIKIVDDKAGEEDEIFRRLEPKDDDEIPGSFIVLFEDDVSDVPDLAITLTTAIASTKGVGAISHVYENIKGFSVGGLSAAQAQQLREMEGVRLVEPDRKVSIGAPPPGKGPGGSDSGDSGGGQEQPWGIGRVNGPVTYSGSNVAWVLDTGIDLDHEDLNVDGSRGFNAFSSGKDSESLDDGHGHGTHVAGTIAAIDNTVGVVGVAAGATVIPVKVLNSQGLGSYSGVIAGVDYVAANGSAGDVANMSLGGGHNQAVNDAVVAAAANGVKFVLAAGNSGANANDYSPASANGPNVYTISAMDVNDNFASFSNYGNPPVDYCAPGVSIHSTWKDGGYKTINGTSMAAPHAAGILLLGTVGTDGTVNGDPDGNADTIIVISDGSWKQIGADLEGETTDDWFGYAVALSADGQTLAVGAIWNMNVKGMANAGQVRVFERARISGAAPENDDEERWRQIGTELEGDKEWDTFGGKVGLSSDGKSLTSTNGCCEERYIRTFQLSDDSDKPYFQKAGEDWVFPEGIAFTLSTDGNAAAVVASGSSRATVFHRVQNIWEEIGTIDVEATDIFDGIRVETLLGDGSLVAIGNKRGIYRVFRLVESEYVQVGQDLDVTQTSDDWFSSGSVRFAASGRILAIGATSRLHLFSLNDNDDNWTSVGVIGGSHDQHDDSDYCASGFGESVSLSSDGSILAVGAAGCDYARVFRLGQDSSYQQLGQDLPSKGRHEEFGLAVSLSADGTLVAVGGPSDDGTKSDSGYVRVFEWQES